MDVNSIQNVDDVVVFLKENARRRRTFSHYTTIDKAEKIISANHPSFYLTRGNSLSMNDQQEPQKGQFEEWNKTFLGCFTWAQNENMAMWALYCLLWKNAVRITIPGENIKKWIDGTNEAISVDNPNKHVPISNIDITDVAYISGKRRSETSTLYLGKKTIDLKDRPEELRNISGNPKVTGYLKNNSWEYEQEVRIRLYLESNPLAAIEKVKIDIPEDLIRSITLTTGPYFEGTVSETLSNRVKKVESSPFKGLINYPILCSTCENDYTPKLKSSK